MSMRRPAMARRGVVASALAVALAFVVTGCGDGGEDTSDSGSPKKSTTAAKNGDQKPQAEPTGTIGEIKGANGIVVTLHSAVRDDGGFVTVNGTVTNHGDKLFHAVEWRSKETEVKSASALSGASLVDQAGKKRYLVLRDTDGECLCSTGLAGIKPEESRPVFAQFPAPPKDVTKVDFQIPTMPSISIEISG